MGKYISQEHKRYIDTKEPGITFLISTPKVGQVMHHIETDS